jgi:hypothetical protein
MENGKGRFVGYFLFRHSRAGGHPGLQDFLDPRFHGDDE